MATLLSWLTTCRMEPATVVPPVEPPATVVPPVEPPAEPTPSPEELLSIVAKANREQDDVNRIAPALTSGDAGCQAGVPFTFFAEPLAVTVAKLEAEKKKRNEWKLYFAATGEFKDDPRFAAHRVAPSET